MGKNYDGKMRNGTAPEAENFPPAFLKGVDDRLACFPEDALEQVEREETVEDIQCQIHELLAAVSDTPIEFMKAQVGELPLEHLCGTILMPEDGELNFGRASHIVLLCGNKQFKIRLAAGKTLVELPEGNIGTVVHAIIIRSEADSIARVICSQSFYNLFDSVTELKTKVKVMEDFVGLTEREKENILNRLNSGPQSDSKTSAPVYYRDKEKLWLKYSITRHTFTEQQQRTIGELFENTSANKGKNLRRLQYLLNIDSSCPQRKRCHRADILSVMDRMLYKMGPVKEKIAEHLVGGNYTKKRGIHLLLVGNPGTGLTTVCRAIALCCGLPKEEIDLSGISTPIDVGGIDSSYEGADAGRIIKAFSSLGVSEAVICLKDIDKMAGTSKEGDPALALLGCVAGEECYDAFLETSVCTANTLWIATCSSLEDVPPVLRSEFEVIHIEDPSDDDRLVICEQYVVPQVLDSFRLGKDALWFDKQAISEIIHSFCPDSGMKAAKKNVQTIVSRVLSMLDSGEAVMPFEVTADFVWQVLGDLFHENDPAIRYQRNKDKLSAPVRAEIGYLLNRLAGREVDAQQKELINRKLHYLTALIPKEVDLNNFDGKAFFETLNASHFGMTDVKRRIAQVINSKVLKTKTLSSIRILLVGCPGSGKTSISKSIAAALALPFIKISLNGATDPRIIKGFVSTYKDADAGEIIKGLSRAGTSTAVVLLDEVDKMGRREGMKASNALLDLLDDSSAFTDDFLGVPVDLSNTLFIATANDICDTDSWLLDRFNVIHVDGYTPAEKEHILQEYLIPKLKVEFNEIGLQIGVRPEVGRQLIAEYCIEGGVRDLDRAIRQLVDYKLFTSPEQATFQIELRDLASCLGPKPLPRGNLIKENIPGVAMALAVTGGGSGMAFSVQSVIVPEDELTITGLARESVVDSAKLAKTFIRTHYLGGKNFGLHLHFGEGSVPKDGPSAGVSIFMSILSALFQTPIVPNTACTGEIDLQGYIFPVGGIRAKIQAAERCGCSRVFIPAENYIRLTDEEQEGLSVHIIPIRHISEVADAVLPCLAERQVSKQVSRR